MLRKIILNTFTLFGKAAMALLMFAIAMSFAFISLVVNVFEKDKHAKK